MTIADVNMHRQKMVDACNWAVRNKAQIHYKQIRPIPVKMVPFTLPITTDCSGWVTLAALWSGNPDPNGMKFNGTGYTGTMLNHLPHIARKNTWRGDLVVFGGGSGLHVVVLMQGGSQVNNPMVCSHGGEVDPRLYTLQTEINYFGSHCPVTYLRLRPNV